MSGWHNQDPLAKIRAPKQEEFALNRVREYAGRVLLVLPSPLVSWGLLEGAAWLAGVEPLAEQRAYRGFATHRGCQFGWRDAERLCAAGDLAHPRRKLLVTLGGSSVFGYPADRAVPLARPLGALLEKAAPRRWKAANRGFPCKDSIFVRDCARHALAAGARVLVIYAVILRASEQGADVMLVTVVSNLHEFPVERERWDDGVATLLRRRPDLDGWAERFERGIALYRDGRFDQAIAAFAEARDLYPRGRAQSPLNERTQRMIARAVFGEMRSLGLVAGR